VVAIATEGKGGVVAGARAQLDDLVTGLDLELLQHHRDDLRLGGRADASAGAVMLGVDRLVGVRLTKRDAGEKQIPRHPPESRLHGRGADGVVLDKPIGQLGAQFAGGCSRIVTHSSCLWRSPPDCCPPA
jgi:hypothetical protein